MKLLLSLTLFTLMSLKVFAYEVIEVGDVCSEQDNDCRYKFSVRNIDRLLAMKTVADNFDGFIGSENSTSYGYIAGTASVGFKTKKEGENFIKLYTNMPCIKYGHKYEIRNYDDGARIETCKICGSRKFPMCIEHYKLEYFYRDIERSANYFNSYKLPECSKCSE